MMTHKQVNPTYKRTKLKKQTKQKAVVAAAPVVSSNETTHAEYLRRVVEIMATSYDAKKIAVALAKDHPEIFVKMHNQTTAVENWHREVITAIYQTNPIAAIKLTRERTGLGLKEAKDIVDNLRVYMSQHGYMMSVRSDFVTALPESNMPIYNALCVSARNMK